MSVLNAFLYKSLCKMKRPLVEPLFSRFYFYTQNLRTMFKGCCIMKFLYIWIIDSREEELYMYFPIYAYVKWSAL